MPDESTTETIRRDRPSGWRDASPRAAAVAMAVVLALTAMGAMALARDGAHGFRPADLASSGAADAWYMTREGFEKHVGDPDAMCAWAADHTERLHVLLGPYGGGGLPMVVADYCGFGQRPEDGSALPAGTSSAWDEYKFDCSRYAHAALAGAAGGAEYRPSRAPERTPSENSAAVACINGEFGAVLDVSEWAYRDELDRRLSQLSPPVKLDELGNVRADLGNPDVCDWISDAVGGTHELGNVANDRERGATYVEPDVHAIGGALGDAGLLVSDNTAWNLANLCHPYGKPALNDRLPARLPDVPHVNPVD